MPDLSSKQLVRGACHHDCPDTCSWDVTVESGRAVELRGVDEHPFTRGQLCPKVNRFLDRVYHPDRLLTPLRRSGRKGSGEFTVISWEDAIGEIAERLSGDDAQILVETHAVLVVLAWFHELGPLRVVNHMVRRAPQPLVE